MTDEQLKKLLTKIQDCLVASLLCFGIIVLMVLATERILRLLK